jgi:hypothetical protein
MVACAIKICNLNETADQFTSLEKTNVVEVSQVTAPPNIAQPPKQARRLPTKGQIAAIRTGPIGSYRGLPKSKFNSSLHGLQTPSYESLKYIQEVKATTKREVKGGDDVLRTESASDSNVDISQEFDDNTRRFTQFGIRPSVKYAKDAHEIIMGDRYPRLG